MKTYDMTHHLRRLVFGGLLLAAAALLPGCEDDPAVPDEEISTDPGDERQNPKPCGSSATIFSKA
ncbi:MAG: hypothetical protein V8Q54_07940 [Alistipes senegalensis]